MKRQKKEVSAGKLLLAGAAAATAGFIGLTLLKSLVAVSNPLISSPHLTQVN
jgi:hypothetical protein